MKIGYLIKPLNSSCNVLMNINTINLMTMNQTAGSGLFLRPVYIIFLRAWLISYSSYRNLISLACLSGLVKISINLVLISLIISINYLGIAYLRLFDIYTQYFIWVVANFLEK